MATYYISPAGDDSTGDGSIGTPWATVGGAAGKVGVVSGDTIYLLDGTYLLTQATMDKSLTFTGSSAENVILDGADAELAATLYAVTAGGCTFSNITFTNILVWNTGVIETHSGTTTIQNCIFHNLGVRGAADNAGIIKSRAAGTVNISNCVFRDIRGDAGGGNNIMFVCVSGAIFSILNCIIYLYDVVPLTAITTGAGANSNWVLKNNIISNYVGSIDFKRSDDTFAASYNCFYGFTDLPTGTGNITANPLFVDKENNVFELRRLSPCRNAGIIV
jgi:hypothetical protein